MKNLYRYILGLLLTGVLFHSSAQELEFIRTYNSTGFTGDHDCRISRQGHLFISGAFNSDSLVIGGQTLYTPTPTMSNLFIAKLDTLGNCIWAKMLYADSIPNATWSSIAIDTSENIYTISTIQDPVDIDPGIGVTILSPPAGQPSKVIAKYSGNGDFIWAFTIDDTEANNLTSYLEIGADQNLVVSGTYAGSTDFDPSSAVHILPGSTSEIRHGFLAKYSSEGNYMWAFSFNEPFASLVEISDIVIDHHNDILMTGYVMGEADFNPHPVNDHVLTSNGSWDYFLAKYSPAGNLIFAHNIGGWHNETGSVMGVDSLNNIYVSGLFNSTPGVDFNPSPNYSAMLVPAGFSDVFFAKYTSDGHLIFARSFGTDIIDFVSLDVDPNGICYWAFRYWGTNWDCDLSPDSTVLVASAAGAGDNIVMITDPQGKIEHMFMNGTWITDNPMGQILRYENSFFLYSSINSG